MTYKIVDANAFNPPQAVQLPSQHGTDEAVLLRRPDVYALIDPATGDAPDPLTNMLMDSLMAKRGKLDMTPANLSKMMGMIDRIVVATLVTPPATLDATGDETHIPVRYIPTSDKIFIMQWALGQEVYKRVETFRQEPPDVVADVQPS